MTNTKRIILVVLLFSIVVLAHLATLANPSSQDDKANYRASAYMKHFETDVRMQEIYNHLYSLERELSPEQYSRYEDRISYLANYRLSNALVLLYEKFPLASAYQSVFLTELTIAAIAIASLIYALKARLKHEWPIVVIILLLSVFPFEADLRPLDLRASIFSWVISATRGSTLVFFSALLILWVNERPKAITWPNWVLGLGFLYAGFLAHASTLYMLLLPSIAVVVISKALKKHIPSLIREIGAKAFFSAYFVLVGLTALAKYAILTYYVQVRNVHFTSQNLDILLLTGILLFLWFFAQTTSSFKQDALGHLGDTLSQFFVAFAILFVGTSLVNFDDSVARWANYQALLVTEFTNRLSGVIHLFFWLLLGILIYRYAANSRLRPNSKFSLGILSLSAIGLFPTFPYVTLFLSSLVLWQQDFFLELNLRTRRVLAILLLLVSLALNAQVTGLYILVALAVFVIRTRWSATRTRLPELKTILLLYNSAWLFLCACIYMLQQILQPGGIITFSWEVLALALAANTFIAFWRTSRPGSESEAMEGANTFNTFILHFFFFSIFAIGLALFTLHFDSFPQFQYLVREVSFNLRLFSVMLLISLVIALSFWLAKSNKRLSTLMAQTAFLAIFLWTCINYIQEIGPLDALKHRLLDPYLLEVRISDLIAEPGVSAYADEINYYQGIANEFREHLITEPAIFTRDPSN